MFYGRFILVAGKQACHLTDTILPRNLDEARHGQAVIAGLGLAHHIVALRHDGKLGQVCDNNDLARLCELGNDLGNRAGSGAAHTCVDLVEDEGLDIVASTEDHLDGQHDAAELTARGNARKRSGLHRGTGTILELDRVGPARAPLGTRKLLDVYIET